MDFKIDFQSVVAKTYEGFFQVNSTSYFFNVNFFWSGPQDWTKPPVCRCVLKKESKKKMHSPLLSLKYVYGSSDSKLVMIRTRNNSLIFLYSEVKGIDNTAVWCCPEIPVVMNVPLGSRLVSWDFSALSWSRTLAHSFTRRCRNGYIVLGSLLCSGPGSRGGGGDGVCVWVILFL